MAQYIIRAPISQERMIYIPAAETKDGVARVIYEFKDGKNLKTFTALDWLAQLVIHIPNKGEQTGPLLRILFKQVTGASQENSCGR